MSKLTLAALALFFPLLQPFLFTVNQKIEGYHIMITYTKQLLLVC